MSNFLKDHQEQNYMYHLNIKAVGSLSLHIYFRSNFFAACYAKRIISLKCRQIVLVPFLSVNTFRVV